MKRCGVESNTDISVPDKHHDFQESPSLHSTTYGHHVCWLGILIISISFHCQYHPGLVDKPNSHMITIEYNFTHIIEEASLK